MSSQFNFVISSFIAITLVFFTVLLHYESLRLISELIPRLKIQPRARILVVIYGAFLAHTLEVWLFGLSYYFLDFYLDMGTFHGLKQTDMGLFDFVYFSVVVYTSVGFGDIYPIGHMRLLAGVEGLLGLLMIGWSASFTYLMMEKLWLDHHKPHKK